MPKKLTYKECRSKLDGLAKTAQRCRNNKKLVSCNVCSKLDICDTQKMYETWLLKSRKTD